MSIATAFGGIAVLFVLLALRVPVALAMIAVSFGGVAWMLGIGPAMGIIANTPFSFVANWTLSAVPMFLLMGFVAYHSGMTTGLFEAAKAVLRRIPGALPISAIFACSGFASVCGSSLATAATMGRIAIPEMVRAGYAPSFAAGAIAAGGTLGALIPPSILMIVYGVFAETSVLRVFLGGIAMGALTALSYCVVVLITCWLRPDIAPPRPTQGEVLPMRQALVRVWPVLALMGMVFGGLFSGIFTTTEAGAIGAGGAILIAAVTRTLTRQVMRDALTETLMTSASLFIIGVGAAMFTRFLGLTGMSAYIAQFVGGADFGFLHLMLIVVVIYLILGMFMEPFGAMLITLPVLLPVFRAEGIDLVWFGVLLVKLLEIGMITPPVGMNCFVIKGVAGKYVTTGQIFRGVTPFIAADLVVVALVILFPAVIMYLPSLL
ncbi:TRAP transporter large permease subunit [Paracoccus aestuarii]|uniref:TRAP transporter large permease protein n=1 Tax=Paracoccus aestuarii TaxID=453842 RepID=A0A418ZU84_9RHOB|nr:TRAP transporter large permease subunit [Paracoccus aestuarii]RJL01154.1 TRAP transporter large permease subunit [Paracoccus aestuarii]WCR01107.1 TRAP transporter large permease subunit [Paracoccus aestuarii]